MFNVKMPEIDLSEVDMNDEEMALAKKIMNGKRVRASRPPLGKDNENGEAAFLWRHVVFFVSPKPQHHCIPVTASFYLPDKFWDRNDPNKWEVLKKREKELMDLADRITKSLPAEKQYGVLRWAGVL